MRKIILLLTCSAFLAGFSFAQDTPATDFPATEVTINTTAPQDNGSVWKQLFNFDWRFQLGDFQIDESNPIDDNSWRDVDLPHDWSIEGKLDPANPSGNDGGYFPTGTGWYQKHFVVPAEWEGKQVAIYFEGVYMNSEVYINGVDLGKRPYGYSSFSYDLTPYLNINEENTISVRVDNSQQKNSRWYSGSGIYRNAWLLLRDAVHIDHWGVTITTPSVSTSEATVNVKTLVKNTTDLTQSIALSTQITNGSSNEINVQIAPNSEQEVEQNITVSNPSLWSPDSPTLYEATIKVVKNTEVLDEMKQSFGIRSIEFSTENGFQLNGETLLLSGGCMHHDNGCLGAAAYDRAEERRVELMKSAGFNAVRTSHNPPSEAFLNACDRLGLLVIDESFDGWRVSKTPYDYAQYFDEWAVRDVQDMVRRDRNHPSIIMWSIGNEIIERDSPEAVTTAQMLSDAVKAVDTTRAVTSAMTTWTSSWASYDPLMAVHDVCGYNYQMHHAEDDHARVPSRIIVQTESYPRDAFYNWNMVQSHSYILGDFVWTAMDYLGESGIGRYYYTGEQGGEHWEANHYPWHGAYCGDIDLIGHRKPISYYREMLYNDTRKLYMAVKEPNPIGGSIYETMWSVWPTWESWTWDGFEGIDIDVEIYSKYPKVRLYLNEELIGEKNTTINEEFKATFTLPYQPGTLKAVGVEGGAEVETTILKTAGPASKIKLTADRTSIQADGQDLVFVTAEITDDEGNVQPNAEDKLVFTIEGGGEIIGVDNANLKDTAPYVATTRKAWKGRAMVVIKSIKNGGEIKLKVGAGALVDATLKNIELSTSALDPVFDPDIKEYTVYVPQGTTSIDVTGIPTYSGATVEGNGPTTLVNGVANVSLSVTSQDGTAHETYTVNIQEADGTNYAMYLPGGNGNNSNIKISGLELNSLPFTMEVWFKPDGSQTSRSGLFFGRNPVNNDNGGIQYLDNNTIIGMSNVSADWDGIDGGTALPDEWHHVAFVVTDNQRTIYLDGVETTQNDVNIAVDYSASNVYIGFDNAGADRAFKGAIDEVRVWNTALSAATIEQNAYAVLTGEEENLIGYWNFDLPNKSTAVDMTNNHHGIITGGTYVESFPRVWLSSLSISDGNGFLAELDPNETTHSVFLPAGTTAVTVNAATDIPGATVTGTGTVNVNENGLITVTVTSGDGLYSTDYNISYILDVNDFTLTHAYTFNDGTARDTVGSADGTIVGGSVADGVYTSSQQGDYIELPAEEIAINTYPSITVEAYVTAGTNNPTYTMLSYFGSTTGTFGTNHFYTTLVNGGKSSAAISCGNITNPWDYETRVNGPLLDNDATYHLVSTLTNDQITWYINGSLVGSQQLASNNSIQSLDNTLAYLCKGGYTADGTWIGSIDEFNIFRGVMDDATIAIRANNFPTALPEPLTANLEPEVIIYPTVSSTGMFTLKTNGSFATITVYDLYGRVIKQQSTTSSETVFTLSDPKMYIVQVRTDGVSKAFKLIKQ